jgi:hypothetical protein
MLEKTNQKYKNRRRKHRFLQLCNWIFVQDFGFGEIRILEGPKWVCGGHGGVQKHQAQKWVVL